MLTQDEIRAAAMRLDRAEKTQTQIRQLSIEHQCMTIAEAYAIQNAWVEHKVSQGRVIRGHKIGLTSKAMQSALGIGEPDSGILFDDMFFADGGEVPSERFIATRVEAELAFVIKAHLAGPNCTIFDVLNATDYVVPALEILDTRIERVDATTKATRKIVAYSTTRPTASPGSPTSSPRSGWRSSPGRSCSQVPSSGRSKPERATRSKPITAPTAW
jgi:2-oxo-hept-3-ene-1,7-dioate hydratase